MGEKRDVSMLTSYVTSIKIQLDYFTLQYIMQAMKTIGKQLAEIVTLFSNAHLISMIENNTDDQPSCIACEDFRPHGRLYTEKYR